jgi:hypothetical protein
MMTCVFTGQYWLAQRKVTAVSRLKCNTPNQGAAWDIITII